MSTDSRTRHGKPHCEAFPALDVRAAARAWCQAAPRCAWVDEDGNSIGSGEVTRFDSEALEFSHDFVGSVNIPTARGSTRFELTRTRRNPDVESVELLCPVCACKVHIVYSVRSRWACRKCHNLVYLKQRTIGVNKLLLGRDEIYRDLMLLSAGKRASILRQQLELKLQTIEGELGASAIRALPRELRFRTYAMWGVTDRSDVPLLTAESSKPHGGLNNASVGLAFFEPRSLPVPASEQCELVGTKLFDRSLSALWRERVSAKAQLLIREWPAGEPVFKSAFAERLALSLVAVPIALSSTWEEPVEGVSDCGRQELSRSASWVGWHGYWRAYPNLPSRQPISAILDEHRVTIRVRVQESGDWNMRRVLAQACSALERKLLALATACEARNANVHRYARLAIDRKLYLARSSRNQAIRIRLAR